MYNFTLNCKLLHRISIDCFIHLYFLDQVTTKQSNSKKWRTLAQTAYNIARGDEAKALQLFDTWCDGEKPDHPRRFMQRWGPRNSTTNQPGQGCYRKISKQNAKRLATIYKRGFNTCGEHRGFRSVAHAKEKSKEFAAILEKCQQPSNKTVLRAIKNADPNFQKVRQTAKKALSDANKEQRRKASDNNLRKGVQRLQAVTFMDEFSLTAGLPNTAVAGDKRKGDFVIKDQFQSKKYRDRPTLHALIAVNYAQGPLYLRWLTGTTGGVGRVYTVSCHAGCLPIIGQLSEYIIKRCSGCCTHICIASLRYCSRCCKSEK